MIIRLGEIGFSGTSETARRCRNMVNELPICCGRTHASVSACQDNLHTIQTANRTYTLDWLGAENKTITMICLYFYSTRYLMCFEMLFENVQLFSLAGIFA